MATKQRPSSGRALARRPLPSWPWTAAWIVIACACGGAAAASSPPDPLPVRAVNLGGWLVVEGWIKPSPFDDISTTELLDGTRISIKSQSKNNTYLSADGGGGAAVVANRPTASSWETFKIWRRPGPRSKFRLRAHGNQFVGIGDGADALAATQADPKRADEFELVRNQDKVRIKAPNGNFLQVSATSDAVTADYSQESTSWDDGDPSVFVVEIHSRTRMTGEFQLCNFYGLDRAASVLKKHWDSFIVEDDFRFMSARGLNAVRIPVAWWITMEEGSPRAKSCHSPFYPGYLQMLDKAFSWATKYSLGVILDLHAAPGSQNGKDHSGSRDGSLRWGRDAANIQRTVAAVGALAGRYGASPSLLAIELLNEPAARVPLRTLGDYYARGYRAVREHTADAYVVMPARLSSDPPEILGVVAGRGFKRHAVDVHYYNLFDDQTFGGMTLDDNIRYVRENQSTQLHGMMSEAGGGPPVLVGEWAAEWMSKNAGTNDGDYRRFARAQLDVFNAATFGWAYWTYRHDGAGDPGWSLKAMMQSGIVSFT